MNQPNKKKIIIYGMGDTGKESIKWFQLFEDEYEIVGVTATKVFSEDKWMSAGGGTVV